MYIGFNNMAIASSVFRQPSAVKRVDDQVSYSMLIELVLNIFEFSSLHNITGGRLGSPPLEDINLRV